jgi:hypothetical protein
MVSMGPSTECEMLSSSRHCQQQLSTFGQQQQIRPRGVTDVLAGSSTAHYPVPNHASNPNPPERTGNVLSRSQSTTAAAYCPSSESVGVKVINTHQVGQQQATTGVGVGNLKSNNNNVSAENKNGRDVNNKEPLEKLVRTLQQRCKDQQTHIFALKMKSAASVRISSTYLTVCTSPKTL